MATDQSTEPIEVRYLGVNLSSEVGANDTIMAVRVVEDRREGTTIFGRTLRADEIDDNAPILVRPGAGDTLVFLPEATQVRLADADRYVEAEVDGYRPITNTIWTWLSFGLPTDPALFRYLLAAARRLDGAHALLVETSAAMTNLPGGFIGVRSRVYRALALAEILVVALGRAIDMLDDLATHFSVSVALPAPLEAKKVGIREMRNAFEHIEDRALGQVQGKPHPDALTVFEQRAFVEGHTLVYAKHSLDLGSELSHLLKHARQHIYAVASHVAGNARNIAAPIKFFDSAGEPTTATLDD